jgi:hypothetical protein
MRVVWVRLASIIVLLVASAAASGLDGPVSFVPWKVIGPGESPMKAPMTLFWVPSSRADFKHSELLFSRALTSYASQCVAMHVIRTDDTAMLAKLGVGGALPVAVLIDGDGKQLGKVDNDRGALDVGAVERLVRDQLRAQEAMVDARLEDARRKAAAGDRDTAVATYKAVWDLRCTFPRKGREAERELKKLESLAANR